MRWRKGKEDGTTSEIGILSIPQRQWVYGRGRDKVELFLIQGNPLLGYDHPVFLLRYAYRKMRSAYKSELKNKFE
jgi:hypothetical protein